MCKNKQSILATNFIKLLFKSLFIFVFYPYFISKKRDCNLYFRAAVK